MSRTLEQMRNDPERGDCLQKTYKDTGRFQRRVVTNRIDHNDGKTYLNFWDERGRQRGCDLETWKYWARNAISKSAAKEGGEG